VLLGMTLGHRHGGLLRLLMVSVAVGVLAGDAHSFLVSQHATRARYRHYDAGGCVELREIS
jgi:hypothetical protein